MATIQVRYIVGDVDAAIAFYCRQLGGKQILLEDPSGNPIELFQPTAPAA